MGTRILTIIGSVAAGIVVGVWGVLAAAANSYDDPDDDDCEEC